VFATICPRVPRRASEPPEVLIDDPLRPADAPARDPARGAGQPAGTTRSDRRRCRRGFFRRLRPVLKTDTAVRMDPPNDLGDLQYPAGKSPAQVATTIEAHGDPNNWPFDSYTTDTLSAEVLVGQGDARQYIPARVEVTGALDGWDVSVQRVGEASQESERPDNVIITLHRAKGPLIFDLGICLVLFALPTLAFAVAIQIALGRRKFVPPFVTWFAAMLFAVIPIRNFLPGSPPPGAWIDQALVIWVLIALVRGDGPVHGHVVPAIGLGRAG
jgi:hypothetical protein